MLFFVNFIILCLLFACFFFFLVLIWFRFSMLEFYFNPKSRNIERSLASVTRVNSIRVVYFCTIIKRLLFDYIYRQHAI